MQRSDRKRRLHFPLARLFPNMVTLGALCCGLSSIRFAMLERWEMAVTFILIAAFLDGMDGRIARMLKATSDFGAQLDSLSDIVSFGVAPVMIMYMWVLHEIKGFGWALVLFYVVCCALRLARFNANLLDDKQETWKKKFFTGVPSPAGAILCILPLIVSFQWGDSIFSYPPIIAIYTAIIGILMSSRIPTFAAKGMRIRHDIVLPFMLVFGLLLTFFVIEPWMTLSIIAGLYLLTIPVSVRQYIALENAANPAESSSQ